MKKTFFTLTTIVFCLASISAHAVAITGSIQFLGGATLNGPLDTATAFTGFYDSFFTPGSSPTVQAFSQSGAYASVPNGTATTWQTFSFAPGSPSVIPLWTFTVGASVYSFDASTINIIHQDSQILNLSGKGVAHISGLDDTDGSWTITVNGSGTTFTFGASSSLQQGSVPDGGSTLLLVGVALSALALARKRLFC